jgi:hypothetical protein
MQLNAKRLARMLWSNVEWRLMIEVSIEQKHEPGGWF